MAGVTLDSIVKRYDGNVLAVDDVSLEIEDGDFVTLVGPSGSGKSTILRMLAGVVTASEGTIRFDEKDVTDVPPQERDVAMVFQNYALYPNMTVRENMEFGLKMQGVGPDERRESVEDAAGLLQIEELLDRDVQQLSGGQQQRVALGRSIVRDPEVFLLDEPLANLDAKLRTEMRATLVELQRELGVTTVYVTHNQIEAMTMSDKVAVLDKGNIQQLAAPQELYRNPANQFVADFIGTPSMNFLDVSAHHGSDGVRITNSVFDISIPADSAAGSTIQDATTDNEEYVLGIRPQDLTVSQRGTSDGELAMEIEVVVVETAGDELILHLEEGDIRIKAVVNERMNVGHGDMVDIVIDPDQIHLFDSVTGDALLH
ncbi:MAG: ABC transporter ATP-binding protein [Haloplanus sp.]